MNLKLTTMICRQKLSRRISSNSLKRTSGSSRVRKRWKNGQVSAAETNPSYKNSDIKSGKTKAIENTKRQLRSEGSKTEVKTLKESFTLKV